MTHLLHVVLLFQIGDLHPDLAQVKVSKLSLQC